MFQHRLPNGSHYSIDLGHTYKIYELPASCNAAWVASKRIVIIIHLYHATVINEIFIRLSLLPVNFRLLVVIPEGAPASTKVVYNSLSQFDPIIISCINSGKDIGGKLAGLMYLHINQIECDFVILAHDKMSSDYWRKNLYDEIFDPSNVKRILNGFENIADIKMAGGHVREGFIDTLWIHDQVTTQRTLHSGNIIHIKDIMDNILHMPMPFSGAFVGGTMFWADWTYFKNILRAPIISQVVELLEPNNLKEPSYAHAMERLFGLLVTANGHKIGKVRADFGKIQW